MEDYELYLKAKEEATQTLYNNKIFQFCANGKCVSLIYILLILSFLPVLFKIMDMPNSLCLGWYIFIFSALILLMIFCFITKRIIIYKTRKKIENKYCVKFKDYRKYQQS